MEFNTAAAIAADFTGTAFCEMHTLTGDHVNKGTKNNRNPHFGRITCQSVKNVMISKSPATFQNWVNKRKAQQGGEADFVAGELPYGAWMDGYEGLFIDATPESTGVYTQYMRMAVLATRSSQYLLDGEPIAKEDIIGLKKKGGKGNQGGIATESKMNVQSVKMDSIVKIIYKGEHE